MDKSREELMQEMYKEILKNGDKVFMMEVATPGCKPDAVKTDVDD